MLAIDQPSQSRAPQLRDGRHWRDAFFRLPRLIPVCAPTQQTSGAAILTGPGASES